MGASVGSLEASRGCMGASGCLMKVASRDIVEVKLGLPTKF